jgi:hypothetical protein
MIDLKRRGLFSTPVALIEIGAQQLADEFLTDSVNLDAIYKSFARRRIDLGQPGGVENFSDLAPTSQPFWESRSGSNMPRSISSATLSVSTSIAITCRVSYMPSSTSSSTLE